jgi:DNA-binding CsgD family transcriptional regulator
MKVEQMTLDAINLTTKQKKYLLFVVESQKSLRDCAKELGIHPVSLSALIGRVNKKYPGFTQRLSSLRRITTGRNHNYPKEQPVGDLQDICTTESMFMLHSRPHSITELYASNTE